MAEIPTREEFETLVETLKASTVIAADDDYNWADRGVHANLAARTQRQALAAYDAQAARIAELEAALHTLVDLRDGDEPAIYDWWYCAYDCSPVEDAEGRERHAPDCPVTLARAVLSKEATNGRDTDTRGV